METQRPIARTETWIEEELPGMPGPGEHLRPKVEILLAGKGWQTYSDFGRETGLSRQEMTDFVYANPSFIASQPGKGYALVAELSDGDLQAHIESVFNHATDLLRVTDALRQLQQDRDANKKKDRTRKGRQKRKR